jgi:hypothetical protein
MRQQLEAGGPRTYALPTWMNEAHYFTDRDDTDVTTPVLEDGEGTFPHSVYPPYGATNYDIMAAHGGLVINALALAKFGSIYNLGAGRPRDKARGGVAHHRPRLGGGDVRAHRSGAGEVLRHPPPVRRRHHDRLRRSGAEPRGRRLQRSKGEHCVLP